MAQRLVIHSRRDWIVSGAVPAAVIAVANVQSLRAWERKVMANWLLTFLFGEAPTAVDVPAEIPAEFAPAG